MSSGPWPDAILRLLADLGSALNAAIDGDKLQTLGDYGLSLTLTSHGDHVATLYEEGWDFTEPASP